MLAPGTIPGPPTSAAPMFETIEPYRLACHTVSMRCCRLTEVVEILTHDHDIKLLRTSNQLHRGVVDTARASQIPEPFTGSLVRPHIMSLKAMPESLYSSAILRQVFKKRPSPSFMMLALCTQVTDCRKFVSLLIKRTCRAMHLATVLDSKVESETGDAFALGPGHDLQVFDDARVAL